MPAAVVEDGGPFYLQFDAEFKLVGSAAIASNTEFSFSILDNSVNGRTLQHSDSLFYQHYFTKTTLIMPFMLRPGVSHSLELRWGRLSSGSATFEVTNIKIFRIPRQERILNTGDSSFFTKPVNMDALVRLIYGSTFYRDPASADIPMTFQGSRKVVYGAAAPTDGTWWTGDRVELAVPLPGGAMGYICTTPGTFGTLAGSPTGSITNASQNVTSVSDTTGIRVGDIITVGSGLVGARVVAINGTTVLTNKKSSATATLQAISYSTPVFNAFGSIAA